MSDVVIRIEGLGKTYKRQRKKEFTALKNINLEINKGEVFGFLGPNGAGKTTTIKILVNLIFPTAGNAWILDKPCSDFESRRRIGYLPETANLYDFLTFEEVLAFAGCSIGLDKTTVQAKTAELAKVLDMERAMTLRTRNFSKGMQQRAGLAYALMGDPDVLILDEPMSGLDPLGRRDFVELIRRLKSEGKTIFFSSHVLSDIENLCDRVGILVKGELRKIGHVSEMLQETGEGFSMRVTGLDGSGKEHLVQLGVQPVADGDALTFHIQKERLTEVMDIIKSRKASVVSVDTMRKSLEDIFMDVVKQNS